MLFFLKLGKTFKHNEIAEEIWSRKFIAACLSTYTSSPVYKMLGDDEKINAVSQARELCASGASNY
jgi:hypothetical protein